MKWRLRWVLIGVCVAVACSLLQHDEPQSAIATLLILTALALATS